MDQNGVFAAPSIGTNSVASAPKAINAGVHRGYLWDGRHPLPLDVIGLPDSTVKYFSMSVVIALGALYFALTTRTHRERLHAAFFLIIPYMIIEVAALAYTWATGQQTIFHSVDYSLGFSIATTHLGSPRWWSDVGTAIPVPVYGDCVGRIRAVGSALCKELNPLRPRAIVRTLPFPLQPFQCGVAENPGFDSRRSPVDAFACEFGASSPNPSQPGDSAPSLAGSSVVARLLHPSFP